MVILGLDTTTRAGSVAVRRGGQLLIGRSGDPTRTHGERLPGDLLAALEDAQVALADVDLFAVASGPGSFTGLRVGLATVQGLALSLQRSVAAIPTLEAMAHAGLWSTAADDVAPTLVIPWLNAHRNEVFSAVYEASAGDQLEERRPPVVGSPEAVLRDLDAGDADQSSLVMVVGDAVEDTRGLLETSLEQARLVAEMPLLAPAVTRLAEERGRRAAASPHGVQPVYVRRPDAELARERQRRQR